SAAAAKVLALQPALDERLALGRALAGLGQLAVRTLPGAGATDAERDAWLAEARAVAAARTQPVVADRLTVLRALAGQVLAGRFDDAPLRWVPPHAKVEDLGAGRVRVTWDFSDPAQAQDWQPVPTRAEDERRGAPVHALSGADGLAVRDGGLELAGTGTWSSSLAFAAPLSIEYEAKVGQPIVVKGLGEGPESGPMQFGLRLCADATGSYLFCFGFGTLYARDVLRVLEQQKESPYSTFYIGAPYHLRLEHDGQRLRALVEGTEAAAIPVLDRTHGRLELWCRSEATVRLDRLVVEATIDRAGLAPQRDAWVAGQLAALGLADADVPAAGGAR
ncbi:MAG TPA: hypothetical protein VFY71_19045, partial [Planctomycetota bacterium]|nr:hypothetical protein [Planctomycetota bacterium]